MKCRRDGSNYEFAVCDFCDVDESGNGVKFVLPIGEKGICSRCASQLEKIIAKVTPTARQEFSALKKEVKP